MEVIQAIRKLLFLEDCLIIPGLGGFVSQYRPAVIDRVTGTFIPPAKEIVFNSALLQNDGTLVNYLSRADATTTATARQKVDDFVLGARNKLSHGVPVFIEGVGHFFQDKNREIRFQADPGTNLFLDSFGLAPFHIREINREIAASLNTRLVPATDEAPATVEFVVGHTRKPVHHRNLRRIAIAMPLLIAFSLMPYNSRVTETLTSSRASMIPEPSLYRLDYPAEKPADTAKLIVYPITDSVKTIEEKKIEVKKEEITIGKYAVVAGCFKLKDNAERLHKQLTGKGYPAFITTMKNGMFKVGMKSFATRQEAVDGLAALKRAEPGMELWVAL
jgi:cell division septation protein DedD/nucleoid DNA-binding protein